MPLSFSRHSPLCNDDTSNDDWILEHPRSHSKINDQAWVVTKGNRKQKQTTKISTLVTMSKDCEQTVESEITERNSGKLSKGHQKKTHKSGWRNGILCLPYINLKCLT